MLGEVLNHYSTASPFFVLRVNQASLRPCCTGRWVSLPSQYHRIQLFFSIQNMVLQPGVVIYAFNPGTGSRGSSEFKVILVYRMSLKTAIAVKQRGPVSKTAIYFNCIFSLTTQNKKYNPRPHALAHGHTPKNIKMMSVCGEGVTL